MQNDSPSRSITLHFSPFGSRSGLVRYSKEGKKLYVLVVPRFWEPFSRCILIPPASDDTCILMVKECDKVKFENIPSDWADLLESCAEWLDRSQAERDDQEDDQENDSYDMNPELQKSFYKLIEITSGKNKFYGNYDESKNLTEKGEIESAFKNYYLSLFYLKFRMETPDFYNDFANNPHETFGNFVHEGPMNVDPFRLFVSEEFIRLVEMKKKFIRQGYVASEDKLPCIRGRLTAQGLVRWIATKIPEFQCEYDEFTPAIPLFQIIVTALETVANGTAFGLLGQEFPEWPRGIQENAMGLRRSLAYIPSLPKPMAASIAGRLRLPRIFSTWAGPLDLARIILQDLPLDLNADTMGGESGIIRPVKTPAIWEKVLEKFATQKDVEFNHPFELNRPWVKSKNENNERIKNPKPDLDVLYTSTSDNSKKSRHITDAKYKVFPTELPSIADQYQMFAYSLLLKNGKHNTGKSAEPKSISLIYPKKNPTGNADESDREKIGVRSNLNIESNSKPTLWQAAFCFPGPEDIIDEDKWNVYLKKGKEWFLKLLKNNLALENQDSAGATTDNAKGK